MGCGKTTIGKQLAKTLQYTFIDTDKEIEKNENKRIPTLFEEYGESYFRECETQLCKDLIDYKKTIISTGGGILQNPINCAALQKVGTIVYLHLPFEKAYLRLEKSHQKRPLFMNNSKDKLHQIYTQRVPIYRKMAHLTIQSHTMKFHDITPAIIQKLSQKTSK